MLLLALLSVVYVNSDFEYKQPIMVYVGQSNFENCLFHNMNETAIYFEQSDGNAITLNLNHVTFADISVKGDASSLAVWKTNVDISFSHVCFSNCIATGKGVLFFIQSDVYSCSHSLTFVSTSQCSCNNRAIYLVGDHQGDIPVIFSNFSYSTTYSSTDIGVYLFCNYNTDISYCTFANNQGNTAIINFEESNSYSLKGYMGYVNMVDNIYETADQLIYVTRDDIVLEKCILHNYNNNNDKYLFGNNGGSIKAINCILETTKDLIETESCTISQNIDQYQTYDIEFFATHNCMTYYPPTTPLETPYETPSTTPENTPDKTPYITPYQTPNETPFSTPENTPKDKFSTPSLFLGQFSTLFFKNHVMRIA